MTKITYFDSKAKHYNTSSESLPWSFLRTMEKKVVLSMIRNIENKTVLEYGAGTGFYSKLLLQENVKSLTVVDSSEKMMKNFSKTTKVTKIINLAETLNLNRKFDFIVCLGMLEFVKDPLRVIKNFNKHSNRKTTIIILVPKKTLFGWAYKLFHLINGNKITLFSQTKIKQLFEKEGWKIEKKAKAGLFSLVVKFRSF